MDESTLALFPHLITGTFIRRLNRFVIECDIGSRAVSAHLPNPGRLWELLLPGRTLSLVDNGEMPGRKMRYTAVAVERSDTPVLLHTQRTNTVVRWLIEHKKIPGMERAHIVKAEAPAGRSRFDFLLTENDRPFYLEVKSCTLFGNRIAMFPDAVTVRGRRHLEELAALSRGGVRSAVIFVIHFPHARYFLPDYHTDLAFSRTFYELRNDLTYKALAVTWDKDLTLGTDIREVTIPWNMIAREANDGGSYIFILHLPLDTTLTVRKLGRVNFPKGYYLYVGSAKVNLSKRLERHLRRKKNFFWHIDYLRDHADRCMALPIRASSPLEHDIAAALNTVADWRIPGFGSSDCSCNTHLFGMHDNPVDNYHFIDILINFRINRLEKEL